MKTGVPSAQCKSCLCRHQSQSVNESVTASPQTWMPYSSWQQQQPRRKPPLRPSSRTHAGCSMNQSCKRCSGRDEPHATPGSVRLFAVCRKAARAHMITAVTSLTRSHSATIQQYHNATGPCAPLWSSKGYNHPCSRSLCLARPVHSCDQQPLCLVRLSKQCTASLAAARKRSLRLFICCRCDFRDFHIHLRLWLPLLLFLRRLLKHEA